MDIIDSLIKSIERFGITHQEKTFDDELDTIITRMKTVDMDDDPDYQWEILQTNYRKLKHIYELIKFHNLNLQAKFMESLDKFMEIIDKQTQVYLAQIDWYEADKTFRIDSLMIRNSLEESLNQNDTIKKIKYVIDAYRTLIYIVEDIRKEKFNPGPPDDSFLDEFDRPYKRSKRDT